MCSGSSDFQAETWLNDINVKIYIYFFFYQCVTNQAKTNKTNRGGNAVWECCVFVCLGWNDFANEEVELRV